MKRRGRTAPRARQAASRRRTRNDYDFDYGGTTGELDQNEYGGDLYGGGRYGRGPFEQSQRYGAGGFDSRTGAYGSLQRQFENRYTSGGYSGLKTSGRALGGPPGVGSVPSKRGRLPRTGTRDDASARARPAPSRRSASGPSARSTSRTSGRSASRQPDRVTSRERPAASAGTSARWGVRAGASAVPGAIRSPGGRSASRAGETAGTRARAGSAARAPAGARSARRSAASAEQRSDHRIQEIICRRLSEPFERFDTSDLVTEHLDASDVTVTVAGGMVTLEGTVPERRMKHYIEDLVDACPGVQDIDNRIRVRR